MAGSHRLPRLLPRLRLLVVTLWAGSLWTVGYLVAPTLFATLPDRVLAGTVAGSMFRSQAWLTLACALALLVLVNVARELEPKRRRTLSILVLAILAGTLASHFGIQPMMGALREAAGPGGVMDPAARSRFGMLHGISSVIYLVQSVLAGVLVVKNT
ncbi:MAG TPA: DUF4149 domain-containing protein [Telluria sp.]